MGSYNVSCFVSRLTINPGDMVYFIPLKCNNDFEKRTFGLHYPTDMYEPVTLPILGEYDDYGTIVAVENEYTRYLEKRYKMKIDKILDQNFNLFDGGVFVHKEIYDTVAEMYYEGWSGKKGLMYDYEEDFHRFSLTLQKELKSSVDSLKFYNKLKKEDDRGIDIDESIKYYRERIKDLSFCITSNNVFAFGMRRTEGMTHFLRLNILKKRFKDEIIAFTKFNHHLYSIATPYVPVPFGEQCGNPYMMKALLKTATAINNRMIKRHKENR